MTGWRRIRGWLADPGVSLKRRVAHGGIWAFLVNGLDRALQLVRVVVLARLLAPEDFGLFGITMLALSALQRFTQTGFEAAIIQKRGETRDDLDTAWIIQVLRGLLLGAVLVAAAPLVASFFEEPAAAALVRALAAVAVLEGLKNIGVVYFRKDIEFHKQFVFRLASTVPDLLASVVAALILRNAWALVVGLAVGRLVQTAASYGIHPYRPRLRFDLARARKLFGFGKYITAQSIVLFLLTEGDDALVGKVLGAASLGLYQVAYRLSNVAATQITHVISRVTFPAYAKIQEEPRKLRRGLLRTLGLTAFLSLPVAGAIGVLAPEITGVFLGESWMPMVPAMQVMCLFGAMRAVGATFGPVYRAVARVDIPLKISLIQLGILACVIYPMTTRWDILGASAAITLAMTVSLVYTSVQIGRVADVDLRDLYRPVLPPLVGAAAAIGQTHLLKPAMMPLGAIGQLAALAALGGVTYLAVAGLTASTAGYRVADLRSLAESLFDQPA